MESGQEKRKKRIRVSKKPASCPNPLFAKWLKELRDEAASKDSQLQHVYSKALKSLLKYPLPLNSGKECKVLQYFGDSVCNLLDKKLEKHLKNGGSIDELHGETSSPPKQSKTAESVDKPPTPKKKVTSREYVPSRRSGPYALLIALQKHSANTGYMLRAALQQAAQPYCDTSFTRSQNGSHYTAWSSMKTLLDKGLVEKSGSPAKYKLTDSGKTLALKLFEAEGEAQPQSSNIFQNEEEICSAAQTVEETIQPLSLNGGHFSLRPHEYEIILCVDNAEIAGARVGGQRQEVLSGLQSTGVNYDMRKLSVGDYVWVCKAKNRQSHQELVLPFIVERKRFDDLVKSIKVGRYKEQKFRLKNCGLTKPVYLVEEYGSREKLGLPEQNLIQAITNTCIVEHFTVYWSGSAQSNVTFLHHMTQKIISTYQGKTVSSRGFDDIVDEEPLETKLLPFHLFNSYSEKQKPPSATEMFAKQLMQLHGISADKAKAITDLYPTLPSLLDAYDSCANAAEKQKLLANVRFGSAGRVIGPSASSAIASFYTQHDFRDL